MAKKKSSKKNAASKDFSNSPFKTLKGLSASEASKAEASEPSAKSANSENNKGLQEIESFAEEMDFLGVQPLPGRKIVETEHEPEQKSASSQVPREENDQAVFLDALGSMEKVFKDELPDETSVKKAVPRRMKQVERGQLTPEAELDLHGLTVDEATSKVLFFLQSAVFHGFKTVCIITGKGLHSSDGPVLRRAVETLLMDQREQVVEWGVAPRRYGGDGALMVFLRDK